MSYKAEMHVDGAWSSNALRFATEAEASAYATNLFNRWTQPTDKRVVESSDPVNYVWDNVGGAQPIRTPTVIDKRTADRIDGFDRDDLGESPDF